MMDLDESTGRAALRVKQVDDASSNLGDTLQETTLGISRVETLFYRTDVAADRLSMAHNRLEDAQLRAQNAQERLNEAIAKSGPGSDAAQKAADELAISQNQLQNAQFGVEIATRRQQVTFLIMLPTIVNLTRDMKEWADTTKIGTAAVEFLRDVEQSEIVTKVSAAVASGAHTIAQGIEAAAVWFTNAGLTTQIILLSALTLGAFAAAAAVGALAGVGVTETATRAGALGPEGGVYTKRSPLKFLTGPLAGVTIPEAGGGGTSLTNVTGPLSTADVRVDLQASIAKEVDADEVGRRIGRRIAEEIRRR